MEPEVDARVRSMHVSRVFSRRKPPFNAPMLVTHDYRRVKPEPVEAGRATSGSTTSAYPGSRRIAEYRGVLLARRVNSRNERSGKGDIIERNARWNVPSSDIFPLFEAPWELSAWDA